MTLQRLRNRPLPARSRPVPPRPRLQTYADRLPSTTRTHRYGFCHDSSTFNLGRSLSGRPPAGYRQPVHHHTTSHAAPVTAIAGGDGPGGGDPGSVCCIPASLRPPLISPLHHSSATCCAFPVRSHRAQLPPRWAPPPPISLRRGRSLTRRSWRRHPPAGTEAQRPATGREWSFGGRASLRRDLRTSLSPLRRGLHCLGADGRLQATPLHKDNGHPFPPPLAQPHAWAHPHAAFNHAGGMGVKGLRSNVGDRNGKRDPLKVSSDGFPLPDSHRQRIISWIDGTGGLSAAFDFTTKGILQEAVKEELWRLRDPKGKPPGVMGWWPSRAVTFLENHDTGSTQGHWPFPSDHVMEGYAYILTHPGIPTVFYDHFYDWGDSIHDQITNLMDIRRRQDIHSRSKVQILEAQSKLYSAIVGDNVCVKIGDDPWSPTGDEWALATSGRRYAVWKKSATP